MSPISLDCPIAGMVYIELQQISVMNGPSCLANSDAFLLASPGQLALLGAALHGLLLACYEPEQ